MVGVAGSSSSSRETAHRLVVVLIASSSMVDQPSLAMVTFYNQSHARDGWK